MFSFFVRSTRLNQQQQKIAGQESRRGRPARSIRQRSHRSRRHSYPKRQTAWRLGSSSYRRYVPYPHPPRVSLKLTPDRILGKGLHSQGGVAKIKPAIEELMQKCRFSFFFQSRNLNLLSQRTNCRRVGPAQRRRADRPFRWRSRWRDDRSRRDITSSSTGRQGLHYHVIDGRKEKCEWKKNIFNSLAGCVIM